MSPTISINPLHAAAFCAAVICILLLLQYAHRRKPFILLWSAGWLLMVPAMLLLARDYARELVGREAVGVSRWLGICTAALFLWSADMYRQTRYVQPGHGRLLVWTAAWFAVAPLVFGTRAVNVPGELIEAAILVGAGSMYAAVLLERRMIGAGMIAFVLFGLAMASVTTGLVKPGQFAFESLILNGVLYAFGALGIHLLVFEDMTYELRATNRRLEDAQAELLQAAITDSLTGCHNRRFLEQVMDRELQRHKRFSLPLSLLFIDVDRFKAVNDTLGHEAGDRVLQYVARFLKRHIREADYVFRWGGDEFLVLITCGGDEAQRKAANLKASFEAAPEASDLPPGIGLSIGWIEVPRDAGNLMPLVRAADERMYRDKGRRRVAGLRPVKSAQFRTRT